MCARLVIKIDLGLFCSTSEPLSVDACGRYVVLGRKLRGQMLSQEGVHVLSTQECVTVRG
jgi:hypothetical protein